MVFAGFAACASEILVYIPEPQSCEFPPSRAFVTRSCHDAESIKCELASVLAAFHPQLPESLTAVFLGTKFSGSED